jgi:putative endopeptidase
MATTTPVRNAHTIAHPADRPSPKDDFFHWVNWDWLQEHPIPASEARWGTFNVLAETTNERIKRICEEAQDDTDAVKGSNVQIVRDFYRSGMDMDARNEAGLQPLAGLISQITGITELESLAGALAALHLAGLDALFQVSVGEDMKRPGRYVLSMHQGGLGMPDRDYYLDEEKSAIKDRYRAFAVRLFGLAGEEDAEAAADAVMRIEQALAEAAAPREAVRVVDKNYHPYSRAKLPQRMPGFPWNAYFEALGVPGIKRVVIGQPDFMKRVISLLENESLDDIKRYLTLTVLRGFASSLGQNFVDEHFDFYGRTLQGLKEPRPLWKNVIGRMQASVLTNAIGPLYADRYFSQGDKDNVTEIVGQITAAFADRVRRLDWMSPATKDLTLAKLDKITFKMGYPDVWVDVSSVDIGDSYAANVLNTEVFDSRRRLGRLDEPVDRTEWIMPPTIVNACADYRREMTFPMAILQPPFFDASADPAYNFGAMGVVVGHELTHFFDDQGSKFDVEGKMNPWWSNEDTRAFTEGSETFVTHYNGYTVEDVQVNGRLTLGENISDVAGLAIAFDAFQRYLRETGRPPQTDDLTPEQKFFIGYGRIWAGQSRHEDKVLLSLIDPHAPGEVRVNAALSATPPFYDAYDITEDDGMYTPPEERPGLW